MTRTREEAIKMLEAYRDKLTNSVSNQLDGDIEAFDVAIETMKSYDIERQKEYNEGFNACFDSLIPNQEKMYERGKTDALKIIEDIRTELRKEIANPPEGSDYECGRLDAFNGVLNLIDERVRGDGGYLKVDGYISREDAVNAFRYSLNMNRAQIQDILMNLPDANVVPR